ncbi:MAG TPA: MFS transporter, partial [Rhodothermales bacterium]|nr:MFS transporter [Rhodothermales bacterium]
LALQDISTDALTIEVVPLDEQGLANGFMWGGKVLGGAGTAAGAAWLLGAVGPSATFAVAAGVTALFALVPMLVRERPGERLLPWSPGEPSAEAKAAQLDGWAVIGRSLRRVLFLPASLLVTLAGFAHGLTYGLFDALMPVLTVQELAWTDAAFSYTSAVAGVVAGVVGIILGGVLVRWLGNVRAIQAALGGIVVLCAAMALAASLWANPHVIEAYIGLVLTTRTLVMVAIFAASMALCWRPVAAAQFALYMAIGNLGIAGGSAMLGPLRAALTYPQIFLLSALLALAGAVLLRWAHVGEHVTRVDAFDLPTATPAVVPARAA